MPKGDLALAIHRTGYDVAPVPGRLERPAKVIDLLPEDRVLVDMTEWVGADVANLNSGDWHVGSFLLAKAEACPRSSPVGPGPGSQRPHPGG